MKKILCIILILCMSLLLGCDIALTRPLTREYTVNLYKDVPKTELTELAHNTYEVIIDGITYRTLNNSFWEPISYKEGIAGVSDYNGVSIIYKTSSTKCYYLDNADSYGGNLTPDATVFDAEIDSSVWLDFDKKSITSFASNIFSDKFTPVFCDDPQIVGEFINSIEGVDGIDIETYESEELKLVGNFIYRTDDELYEGLQYRSGQNIYALKSMPNRYFITHLVNDEVLYSEITDFINPPCNG